MLHKAYWIVAVKLNRLYASHIYIYIKPPDPNLNARNIYEQGYVMWCDLLVNTPAWIHI